MYLLTLLDQLLYCLVRIQEVLDTELMLNSNDTQTS
jgi:hypothetical protein